MEPLSSVFENLDAHFRRQDQLADANNAYYQAKYAELQEARESGWSWDRSCKELAWVFWGLPSGYGTKFWWLLSWVLIVDLIFTLLYSTWGKLHRYESPEGKQDFTFKPRLLDMPWDYIGKGAFPEAMPRMAGEEDQIVPAGSKDDQARVLRVEDRGFRKILTAFLFSTVMLLKVGFRDTTVSGHIGWVDLRVIVWFEWVLGFLLVAALTITLANTQPLLNKLVTGVF